MQKKWQTKLYRFMFINKNWFLALSPCKVSLKYSLKSHWNLHLPCLSLHNQKTKQSSSKMDIQCCGPWLLCFLGHLLHHYPDIFILNGHESPNTVRTLTALFFVMMMASLKLLFRLHGHIWSLKWTAKGAPSWAWLSRCDLHCSWLQ